MNVSLSIPYRHKGHKEESRYSCTEELDDSEWSASHPGRFIPTEQPLFLLNRRPIGPPSAGIGVPKQK